MKLVVVLALLLCACSSTPATHSNQCPLEGKWQSNREKTLADLAAKGQATERQRELLVTRFPWGSMIKEFTCTSSRSYSEGQTPSEWIPATIAAQPDGSVLVRLSAGDMTQDMRLTFQGECFTMPIEKFGFSEFFCPVRP